MAETAGTAEVRDNLQKIAERFESLADRRERSRDCPG
jgi:hypothetical protein